MKFKQYIAAALLAGSVSANSFAQETPLDKLYNLADRNYKRLTQPYETSLGVLKSEPEDLGIRFWIRLSKGDHVLEVSNIATGRNRGIFVEIRVDDNKKMERQVYDFYTNGKPFGCRTLSIDKRGFSSPGKAVEYNLVECRKRAAPHINVFTAALEEYEKRENK